MIIDGTTLDLIEKAHDDKCICQCTVCGTKDVYNLRYLQEKGQECKTCKEFKRALNDESDQTKKEINKLLKQESDRIIKGEIFAPGNKYIDTKNSLKGLPLNKEFGDYVLIGYIGLLGGNGRKGKATHAVLKCNRCGYIRIYDIKAAATLSKLICGRCSKIYKEAEEREIKLRKEIRDRKLKAKTKIEQAKQKKIEAAEQKEIEKAERDIARVQKKEADIKFKEQKKRQRIADKESAKLTAYKESIQEKNPDYFVKVRREGDGFLTTLICKNCGSAITFTNTNKTKVYKCDNCKKKEANPFYKGVYQRDYTNTVFNDMRIIRQYVTEDGYKCDIECRQCRKQFLGEDLYDVLNRKIFCDCERAGLFWVCTDCYKGNLITPEQLMNMGAEGFTCDCGNKLSKQDVENEIVINDAGNSMRDKSRAVGELFKSGDTEIKNSSQLIKERVPLYAGTDGEYYYRCHCMEHNISLILNNTEIENYDHTQCFDTRQKLLSKPDADKIKL